MSGEMMLKHAARVVADRRGQYGEPEVLFRRIAVRWSQTLDVPVTPAQVALCLIDLKLARLAHDPSHGDSLTDVAGYAACLEEIVRP
jgi:hypothetical protein